MPQHLPAHRKLQRTALVIVLPLLALIAPSPSTVMKVAIPDTIKRAWQRAQAVMKAKPRPCYTHAASGIGGVGGDGRGGHSGGTSDGGGGVSGLPRVLDACRAFHSNRLILRCTDQPISTLTACRAALYRLPSWSAHAIPRPRSLHMNSGTRAVCRFKERRSCCHAVVWRAGCQESESMSMRGVSPETADALRPYIRYKRHIVRPR